MAQETITVGVEEDLDSVINRLRQSRTKDVLVMLPGKTRALETLDQFNMLRRVVREESINLTFSGGSKTAQGLAKLLGFQTDKSDGITSQSIPSADSSDDDNLFANFGETPSQQPTRVFNGVPQGFVTQTQPPPPLEPTQPLRRPTQEFFNQMPNIQVPDMMSRPVPPPPPVNFLQQDINDTPRETLGSFLELDSPPPKPAPSTDFDSGGARTMTYEEAAQFGYFGDEAPIGDEGNTAQFPFDLTDEQDDDVPSVLGTTSDNAAADFKQRSGVRRSADIGRSRKKTADTFDDTGKRTPKGAGLAAMATGLTANFGRLLPRNRAPKEAVASVSMGRTPLPPDVQSQRARDKNRFGLFALVGVAGAFIILIGLLLITLGGGQNQGNGNASTGNLQRVNLILATSQVTNTVPILLDTSSVSAVPTVVSGSSSTSNPTDQPQGVTPGRLNVTEVTTGKITKTGTWPAFGSLLKADGVAQGQASFVNSGASPRSLGAGAVIYTNQRSGVQYRLISAVTIPAGDPFTGAVGRAVGQIQASAAGSSGNFEGASRVFLTDSLGASIGPVTGGTERKVQVVSKEDRAALEQKLVEDARAQAKQELQGRYDPNTQGIQFLNAADNQCQFSKNVGDEAAEFSGTCSVSQKAYIYNQTALADAVRSALVKDPRQQIDPTSLKFVGDGQVNQENGRLIYVVPVTATLYSPLTDDMKKDIATLGAGKSPEEARTAILQKYNQYLFDVNFSGFTGTLPDASKLDLKPVFDYQAVSTSGQLTQPTPKA
ncbi:MAG: hypothetical protein HXX08_00405 [Chloroflexi bacterium]|uniref:Baseplate protein J-like domain-containing protein n=1 Tax=Candidatus Chlorohelix allophototropha TaxID=3003348 RepID=A0A8T7M242_9CHLR|nr:hypothetical protein [Chloroflexota bacterium]WJW66209.1 hypothetical protein OZ401_002000 [Chloroflexota bacterium L227-S17]